VDATTTTTLLTSQTTNIINYLITNKYTNGTSVMGQVFTIVVLTFLRQWGNSCVVRYRILPQIFSPDFLLCFTS